MLFTLLLSSAFFQISLADSRFANIYCKPHCPWLLASTFFQPISLEDLLSLIYNARFKAFIRPFRCSIFEETFTGCITPDILCGPVIRCPWLKRLWLSGSIYEEELPSLICSGRKFPRPRAHCNTFDKQISTVPPNMWPSTTMGLEEDACGEQIENKIVGGTQTDLDEFPWMAVLEYKEYKPDELVWLCGGVLISSRYVLTAAHCIEQAIQPMRIVLGDYDILNKTDCVSTNGNVECAPPPIILTPEKLITHPEFNGTHHDIALIRLSAPAKFSNFVKPICLPKPDHPAIPNTNYTIAGWGLTEKNLISNLKLKLQVPVISRERCSEAYKMSISEYQICAGGMQHRESRKGDSGGPLMSVNLETGRWFTIGIISRGPKQVGHKGVPTIFTFVPKYLYWIQDNMIP